MVHLYVAASIILIHMINRTVTVAVMPNRIKIAPLISLRSLEMRISLIGSASAEDILIIRLITPIFITGTAHTVISTIIPAVPTLFFISLPPEMTVSSVSDKKPPTTGTRLPTVNLTAFAVMASSAGAEKP